MSGGFALFGQLTNSVSASATGVTSGAANTKGSWSQILASTVSDTVFMTVTVDVNAVGFFSIDIGVGAAASEIVLIGDLTVERATPVAGQAAILTNQNFAFPVSIPAGTRIAARCQDSVGSGTVGVNIIIFDGGFDRPLGTAIDTVGFSSATSFGTAITGGAGSKGSYAQITASTSSDYAGFFLAFDSQNTNYNYETNMDLAIGAGGSEKIILPDFYFYASNVSGIPVAPKCTPFFPIPVPSGTRIAARGKNSSTGGNFGVVFYGVRQ